MSFKQDGGAWHPFRFRYRGGPEPQHIPKARGLGVRPQWKVVASRLPQAFPPPFQEGLLERGGFHNLGIGAPVQTQSSRPIPNFLRERVTTLSKRPLPTRGSRSRSLPLCSLGFGAVSGDGAEAAQSPALGSPSPGGGMGGGPLPPTHPGSEKEMGGERAGGRGLARAPQAPRGGGIGRSSRLTGGPYRSGPPAAAISPQCAAGVPSPGGGV